MDKKIKNQVGIFALGGLGEIGKNCYCVEYNNMIFIIDSGVLFPDESLLGIDYVIPDFTYLENNYDKIVGLFITHGHEDHIGSIPYLLKKVKIPAIYASRMAADLISDKLLTTENSSQKIVVYDENTKLNFNGVKVGFIRINHSIPDSFGVDINIPGLGHIFQTGDFKIDMTPVGPDADLAGLARLGEEGTLCLMSDSTNAERTEPIHSERVIGESINDIFTRINGRVIIVTFASNVYRIQQIIDASINTNRKIAIFGRSMAKIFDICMKNNFLKLPDEMLIPEDKINNYRPEELTIICTGSQGEPLAVLSRIANGSHKVIKALPTDTVIFSSSPIPGNYLSVNKTINKLSRLGINVITHGPLADTHASGHASQEGLQLMLNLVKPKYFMPIHGEHRMQVYHKIHAMQTGVKEENCFVMDNGDYLVLEDQKGYIKGKIPSGVTYIDGSEIGGINSSIIHERKLLSKEGIFVVICYIDKNHTKQYSNPSIISRGFIYVKENEDLINKITTDIKKLVDENISLESELLKKKIEEFVNNSLYSSMQRNPLPLVIIREL